eukprot:CAMPEP_0119419756 /NCGR_PEP_ID=MMETSP1335-20130426/21737_1 /TAXON_ID=259385 /ORGANISM="Chrysoculter rhomboideus, Strain RCC1486" /LENGTH=96 /DNA_ID=CAMNT_0007445081 /DNA_START=669 /DNA_END=956 /DNA_ORIENTATION=+
MRKGERMDAVTSAASAISVVQSASMPVTWRLLNGRGRDIITQHSRGSDVRRTGGASWSCMTSCTCSSKPAARGLPLFVAGRAQPHNSEAILGPRYQ